MGLVSSQQTENQKLIKKKRRETKNPKRNKKSRFFFRDILCLKNDSPRSEMRNDTGFEGDGKQNAEQDGKVEKQLVFLFPRFCQNAYTFPKRHPKEDHENNCHQVFGGVRLWGWILQSRGVAWLTDVHFFFFFVVVVVAVVAVLFLFFVYFY